MRKILLAVLIAILALTFGTVSAQEAGNVLIMARAVDATGLDPHTQTAFASFRLLELIYEPLVSLDADLNVVPALAESWEFSDDALTLTLHLREGVTFHNGAEFTAEDVVATFERILDEDTAAAARANYLNIGTIDTPDDYTVVFNLTAPDVPLLAALATTNAAIADSADIESGDVATVANGTGPFTLDNWTPDQTTMLAANADWWGDGPFVDGIEVRIIPDETSILAALRAGTIDFALLNDPVVATLLVDDPTIVLNRTPSINYHVLQLRAAEPPLDQLAVRQAISCAIDRQEVVDTAALGEGQVSGPLTMPTFALPVEELECYSKDIERARELLAEAGLPDGFTLTAIGSNDEPPTAIPELQNIQAQLAEIGITIEIEPLEGTVYIDRWLAGEFQVAIALNGGRPDPYTMYARYWQSTGNLNNVAGYSDETLDELMAQGREETDPEARYEIFAEFQRHLAEQAPWVWLYVGYNYSAQQPYVMGFVPHPTSSLLSLAQVTLER